MTLKDFSKMKFRHSEEIIHNPPGESFKDVFISCMLLAVDFEQGLFKLIPFDTDKYLNEPFYVIVEYCNRPTPKLKIKK